jgi:hypothetical protein
MRPPEKAVRTRIRIKGDRRSEVEGLMRTAGLHPIYVEEREDGAISFWIGEAPGPALRGFLDSIPKDAFALQGTVHG